MMKKNVWSLVVLAFALVFTACSSDDEEKQNIAETVAGTYVGKITVAINNGQPTVNPTQDTIYVKNISDNIIDLELKNFMFAGMIPVAALKVPRIRIENDGRVSGNAFDLPIFGAIKADLSVNGVLNANKVNLKITVLAPEQEGGNPTVMDVTFLGEKNK